MNNLTAADRLLYALIGLKYPETDQQYYEAQLEKTVQRDFRLISEYDREIKKLFSEFCMWSKVHGSAQEEQEKRYFFRGLHNQTRLELTKQGIYTRKEAIRYIEEMEKVIIEFGASPVQEFHEKPSEPKFSPPPKTAKWCTRHGSCEHSTEECKALKYDRPSKQKQINLVHPMF